MTARVTATSNMVGPDDLADALDSTFQDRREPWIDGPRPMLEEEIRNPETVRRYRPWLGHPAGIRPRRLHHMP
jgi:hypothetical protein